MEAERKAGMPYTKQNAPDWVKELPNKLKDAWIKAYNSALEQYEDEEKAAKVANSILAQMGKKDKDGKWILKEAVAPEGSLDEIQDELWKLKQQIQKELVDQNIFSKKSNISDTTEQLPYIKYLFKDKIIVEYDNKMYEMSINKNGDKIEFGDRKEVEEKIEIKTKESKQKGDSKIIEFLDKEQKFDLIEGNCHLIESKDDEGFIWRVRLIKSGLSHNRNYYPEKTLKEAISLYEGVRALVRSDDDHIKGAGVNVNNLAGWYENVEWNDKSKSIEADFHLTESQVNLRGNLKSAWENGKKNFIGFSHDAIGKGYLKRISEGLVKWIDKIIKVNFVDVVVDPSAGGQVLRMVASKNEKEKEEIVMIEKLLKLLESVNPDAFKEIDLEKIGTEVVMDKVIDGLKVKMNPVDIDKLVEALKKDEKSEEEKKKKDNEKVSEIKIVETVDKTSEFSDQIKKLECRIILKESLSGSKLPKAINDKIVKRFDGKVFEADELKEAIKDEENLLTDLRKELKITEYGEDSLGVKKDEADKIKEAWTGFFMNRKYGETEPFFSIREAYIQTTGDSGFTGRLENAPGLSRFAESITTTVFAQIAQDAMHKALVRDYAEVDLNDWRKITSVVPLSDTKTVHRIRYGGYGNIPTVSEGGTYQPLTSPTDEEATYLPYKKGGTEDLTLETIMNDDVGAARSIPRRMARAAAQTLHEFIFDFIKSNSAIYDGSALFVGGHSNYSTDALSSSSLITMYQAMQKQTDMSNSKRLGIRPKYILYPIDLSDEVYKLLNTPKIVGSGNNDASIIMGVYKLEPIEVAYWTDATNYYLAADMNTCPLIEVGFMNNKQEPELVLQNEPTVGSMFTADKLTYRLRHWYGGGVLDYRGFSGAIVAG